jgi:ABC-type dipeptide/oligopeptide/nickel transport system permease subunit
VGGVYQNFGKEPLSLSNVMLAIGVVGVPTYARLARGQVLSVREWKFVQAARAAGGSDLRILAQHVLPNIMAPIIVEASLHIAAATLAEAGLSFLGLGVQPPTPSWGAMLNVGRGYLEIAPWMAMLPGAAIFLTVLGFNVLPTHGSSTGALDDFSHVSSPCPRFTSHSTAFIIQAYCHLNINP